MAWLIFLLSAALAAHFLVLYPLLLRFVPFRPRPVAKDLAYLRPVSILIAVHNGAEFLRAKLQTLLELNYPPQLLEVVLLDDASTDATIPLAREFAAAHPTLPLEILSLPKGGKSAAINAALVRPTREILFFTDIRQPLHPDSLRHLVANFADPTVGAVTGQLCFLSSDTTTNEQPTMDLYWRYELWVRQQHSLRDSLFNTTGCIYAMRSSLARPIPPDTLGDDAELPLQAYFAGQRIVFDPLAIAYDYPHRAGGEWGRRMRTLAGMWQTYSRHPRLLLDPRRMCFHFFSHKLGRVLLPWVLLVNLAATFFLPDPTVRATLLAGNAGLALLAFLAPHLPKGTRLQRLAGSAYTFLSMNFAALASVQVFFRDPRTLWTPSRIVTRQTP